MAQLGEATPYRRLDRKLDSLEWGAPAGRWGRQPALLVLPFRPKNDGSPLSTNQPLSSEQQEGRSLVSEPTDATRTPQPPEDEFVPCGSCQGTGTCLTCNGTGLWYADTLQEERCGSCKGDRLCWRCGGSGLQRRPKS
jgi:hypothetical protein